MIEPLLVFFIEGTTDFMPKNTETWLISRIRRYSSNDMSNKDFAMVIPALFTRTLTGPNLSSVVLTTFNQSSSLVTSCLINSALSPREAAKA